MIGKTIASYKVLEKLGEGGMGVVYKAIDEKLKRTAALKFLPQELTGDKEAKERFLREAQAAAALDDQNICTIYEVNETKEGQLYIAMAYYDGVNLKELINRVNMLSIGRAIDFAQQVGRGLAKAHDQGVVHRDIKTANIIITTDEIAKILDFGLAKFAGQTQITRTGTTLGTVDFMSPEQAKGEPVDHRSDIWSVGVVLYNMLAGTTPFRREVMQAVIFAVINDEPLALSEFRTDVPYGLTLILTKAMTKNPNERYQSITDFVADLETLKTSSSSDITRLLYATNTQQIPTTPAIAVLPFTDMSAEKDQEYFCDGLAEELINHLCEVKELKVISRTSSFSFRNKDVDIREIARILNVSSILEGSVRKAGNRIRISAQLVKIDHDYQIVWSEKWDRDVEDIFAIQDEISRAILDNLKIKLLGGKEVSTVKRQTDDQEAYNLFLQGQYFWNRRYDVGVMKAMEYFLAATEKDPEYPLPWVGIADTYIVLGYYGHKPFKECYPKAIEAAEKALKLDPKLGPARNSLAFCKAMYDWNWNAAAKEFELAVEEKPTDTTTRTWYCIYLTAMGRFTEAINQSLKAVELEPLSPIINAIAGWTMANSGHVDDGIGQLSRALELDPNLPMGHLWLAQVYIENGESFTKAIKHLEKSVSGEFHYALGYLGWAVGLSGNRPRALKILDQLTDLEKKQKKYIQPTQRALVYLGIDEYDLTFKYLEKAYQEKDSGLAFLRSFRMFDKIRKDERFTEILKKINRS
ncbi:MAG: protein kinase [Acidobacteria bacterium]|nr:protein kinase [Acidobacteriota bacterium]